MAIDDKRQNCKRVLVRQGGEALDASQGGVYEAVTLRGGTLDWVTGITSAWIAAVSSSSRSQSNMATFSTIRPGSVVRDRATTPPCRTTIATSSGSARRRAACHAAITGDGEPGFASRRSGRRAERIVDVIAPGFGAKRIVFVRLHPVPEDGGRTPQRALGEHSVNAVPMPAAAGEFTHVVVLSIARDGRSVPPGCRATWSSASSRRALTKPSSFGR
jgi:hypothetical protein